MAEIIKRENAIKSYKAFDKDFKCKGFQYEVGKEYQIDGEIQCCEKGFHACESPMELFKYYDMLTSRFAEVEQYGEIDREINSTKVCSSHIKIKAELKLSDIINLGIEWMEKNTPTDTNEIDNNRCDAEQIASSGNYSNITSSGDHSTIGSSGKAVTIGSSGNDVKIGSIGKDAKIVSSGKVVKIGSSGNYSNITSSGDHSTIGSSGYGANIESSGDYSKIGSSGEDAKIGSSGHGANIESSGDYSRISSSGDKSTITSSGDYGQIASSGYGVNMESSGDCSKISSSGEDGHINSSGEYSVVMCAGNNSVAKAKVGSWITLSEWAYDDKKERPFPKFVKTEYVDGERIKGDTWYKLIEGEFKEVETLEEVSVMYI